MKQPEIANEQPDPKVIVFVLLLALLWGGYSVSIKIGLQGVPPLALAGLRFLLGLVTIMAWSASQGIGIRLRRGELPPLMLLGAIFILQICTLNTGTHLTSASRSTVMINIYPFVTAVFAHYWVPGDRLSVTKTVGIVVAFFGVLITFVQIFNLTCTSISSAILLYW